jgi:hypothetical protein
VKWARDRRRNGNVDGELRDHRGFDTRSFSYQFYRLPQSFDFQFRPLTSGAETKGLFGNTQNSG